LSSRSPFTSVRTRGGAEAQERQARAAELRKKALDSVVAPRLSGRRVSSAGADDLDADRAPGAGGVYVPQRRPAAEIKAELDEIEMRKRYYRPAHQRAISSDTEKAKLAQINEYHGGKALPTPVMAPFREAPFEAEERRQREERLRAIRAKNRGLSETPSGPPRASEMSTREALKMQIAAEINDRVEHLGQLREAGVADPRAEATIKADIARRVKELNDLEAKG
jgi:plasmid stabilization system protein ParE